MMFVMVPRAAASADRIQEVLDTRAEHRRPGRPRRPRRRARAPWSSATSSSATPAPRSRCSPASPSPPARGDHRHRRQHRQRQVHAGQPGPALLRRHRRSGAGGRRGRPRPRPRRTCGAASASSRRRPFLFSGTVASNVRDGTAGATDDEVWQPSRSPRRGTSSTEMRRAGGARSPRAAPTSPAGSASASPSPGRWCAGRRSTCSTTASPPWTSPPTPAARRPARARPARRRCSSSPSGWAPSCTPTASWCSPRAPSPGSAPTRSCSDQRDLPGDRLLPAHPGGGGMSADGRRRRRPAAPGGPAGRPGRGPGGHGGGPGAPAIRS